MLKQSFAIFRHRSVFVRMQLFFIVLIVGCILTVGFGSYYTSSTLLINEVVESNETYIEQARDNIDKEIEALDNVTRQISVQPILRRALYMPDSGDMSSILVFTDVMKYLNSVKLHNPLIQSLWLHFYRFPVVVSNESKYSSRFFYEQVYPVEPLPESGDDKADFRLISLGRQIIQTGSDRKPVIVFARPAPPEEKTKKGVLYVTLDADEFAARINHGNQDRPQFTYIADGRGNIVLSHESGALTRQPKESDQSALMQKIRDMGRGEGNFRQTIDGTEHLVVYVSSHVNEWTYISLIPVRAIMEKSDRIQNTTLLAAVICLLSGLVVSYLLAGRLYAPINQIIQYLNAAGVGASSRLGGGKLDELGFINRMINYVYDENRGLKDTFEKNQPVLREKFLTDLLEGRVTASAVEETAPAINLNLPYSLFQIAVFETVDFGLDDQVNAEGTNILVLLDSLAQSFGGTGVTIHYVRKRSDKVVAVFNLDEENPSPEIVYDFVKLTAAHFEEHYARKFTVGIGRVCSGPESVSFSYLDALRALRYKSVKGQGSIIFVDEVSPASGSTVLYSMDVEKQIMNLTKIGRMEELQQRLNEVLEQNRQSMQTEPELVDHLFYALAGTAVRTIYDIQAAPEDIFGQGYDLYRELTGQETLQGKRDFTVRLFRDISNYIHVKKESQSEKLLHKVRTYVEKHYQSELSLSQLAESLDMSPTYLSSKFKEIAGMNFVDYVHGVRIAKAKEYLSETDWTVAAVSEAVGILNVNTFIKVFKKYEGITPGQYRQMKSS
ncbi:AraC family transcriptional regulator [Paenibacillus mucilaginosus 3016]|uniref:AraC family transcriptional regulator n=2 Tax=Paenibacillus mucilaginosus TaxID=61624 RepID=H6NDF7_9BACL|nr:helix-turn-helix domain-containing protein [Paenibacillus mucilaginosus]AFC30670.1 AraC family transcriptional regulator [Paenibacillus mucilaginosus 3016]AFH62988.1 AraC family transcriptional regulator [Paenibacillus mucilaginosus K02]WFA19281.1 AraC family transcriptional regulator [Paenibacillus mucilaginosus]